MSNKSDSIASLAKALAAAQSEMGAAQMTAVNPFLKNKYADLGEVIKAAKPALAKNGLAYSQLVETVDQGSAVIVTTLLMHESGEWLETACGLPLGKEAGKSLAQAAGSVITYLRRYSLAAMLGMYSDEDDDGNEHLRQPAQRQPAPTNGKHQPAPPEKPPAEANPFDEPKQSGGYNPESFVYAADRQYARLGKYKWPSNWYQTIRNLHPKAVPQEVEKILLMLEVTPDYNGDVATGAVSAWLKAKEAGEDDAARYEAGSNYITACLEGKTENG